MYSSWIARGAVAAGALLFSTFVTLQTEAQEPKRGGILNFAVTAEPPNYDCHSSQTFALLHPVGPHYSYLVKFDASQDNAIIGDLAKSWTVAPDGLTYTFKLYDGITFHDGSPLTSTDVLASYERIRNPPAGVVSLRRQLSPQGADGVVSREPRVAIQLHL
jgi:peptide/nickel transport system substrate-binding protein